MPVPAPMSATRETGEGVAGQVFYRVEEGWGVGGAGGRVLGCGGVEGVGSGGSGGRGFGGVVGGGRCGHTAMVAGGGGRLR
ncbi:hypothetical protein GCM10011428_75980 [Streptomyces violaceus]